LELSIDSLHLGCRDKKFQWQAVLVISPLLIALNKYGYQTAYNFVKASLSFPESPSSLLCAFEKDYQQDCFEEFTNDRKLGDTNLLLLSDLLILKAAILQYLSAGLHNVVGSSTIQALRHDPDCLLRECALNSDYKGTVEQLQNDLWGQCEYLAGIVRNCNEVFMRVLSGTRCFRIDSKSGQRIRAFWLRQQCVTMIRNGAVVDLLKQIETRAAAVCRIQSLMRGILGKRILFIVRIQSLVRGISGRKRAAAVRRISGATRVQALVRGRKGRRRAAKLRCAIRIQSLVRGTYGRERVATVRRSVSASRIQALVRGRSARRLASEGRNFKTWWTPSTSQLPAFSWETYKESELGMAQAFEDFDDESSETYRLISNAAIAAMESANPPETTTAHAEEPTTVGAPTYSEEVLARATKSENGPRVSQSFENIKLTHNVVKWFKDSSPKFRDMFCRRISQLASGEKSRILRKHLTGSKHTIWETYLDQSTAQRLIWTECRNSTGEPSILVWYVSKHKWVSRYMVLIDKMLSRMGSPRFHDIDMLGTGAIALEEDTVMIDPLGNAPLRIHEMPTRQVFRMVNEAWIPPLHLTSTEKEVVHAHGTVLVLGRSGTGKTVCVCNKIAYDLENHGEDDSFKQLFVSRSHNLCTMVKSLVEASMPKDIQTLNADFSTFQQLSQRLSASFESIGHPSTIAPVASLVTFDDFKLFVKEKACPKMSLDPLVIWTQIRSYIKGSIEGFQTGSCLDRDDYVGLGKSRCRLSPKEREVAYDVFLLYQTWLKESNRCDDSDLIFDLLLRINRLSLETRQEQGLLFDSIYVDEVQDFTQIDIALFWKLCEGRSLFLAGDTAQSVVQGVAFRFDEVRSVASSLCGQQRNKVPSKPFVLSINYRSHTGILDIAALVLQIMYDAFPGSANKVDPDKGLFRGPRPSIFSSANFDKSSFQEVIASNPGIVLLTQQSEVGLVQEMVGHNAAPVFDIVTAKGLDFDQLFLVNFFCGLPEKYHKPWVNLLNDMEESKTKAKKEAAYPELEMQLKLLYTAITRCRNRLFFLETRASNAGDKFYRELVTKRLADKQQLANLQSGLKTPGEWISQGIEFAIDGESSDSHDSAAKFFELSRKCFLMAGKANLAKKVECQKHALGLLRLLRERQQDRDEDNSSWVELLSQVPEAAKNAWIEGFIDLTRQLSLEYVEASNDSLTSVLMQQFVLNKLDSS